MRAVVERVKSASVIIGGELTAHIEKGILVLLGIARDDTENDIRYIIDKTINLRIFEDDDEKMNLSLNDVGGQILLVSQFTLMGDARKGRRPGFTEAGSPDKARPIYEKTVEMYKAAGVDVRTGTFQANMQIEHVNDGPVTILLDSRKTF